MVVLDNLEVDKNKMLPREEYYAVMLKCKRQWFKKREQRQRDEMYLENPSFPNGLRRSLDKFSKTAINKLGFNIIKLKYAALK
jgi:hypothetical protein